MAMNKIKKFVPTVALITVVALFSIAGGVFATNQFTSVAQNVQTQNVYLGGGEDPQLGGDVIEFGRIDDPVRGRFSGFTSINVTEELRFGENNKLNNGYSMGFKVFDLSATSSATELNDTGETLYVYDAYVRVQTATTSDIGYLIGTSSAAFIARDGTCGTTGVCGATTAGEASILNTTNQSGGTTVGDTFFKADYQGTDTRDGSGTRFVVPIIDQEYISCFASTTPDANLQVGGQATQCVVKYYTLDD